MNFYPSSWIKVWEVLIYCFFKYSLCSLISLLSFCYTHYHYVAFLMESSMGCGLHCLGWVRKRLEEACRELGVTGTSATPGVVRFTVPPLQGGKLEWWVPLQGGGWGCRSHCFPFLCGHQHHCGQEAGVICATSPDAAGFSRVVGSAVMAGGPGLYALPMLFTSSTSSMCSSPPIFRCTDVWNSPASWCIE